MTSLSGFSVSMKGGEQACGLFRGFEAAMFPGPLAPSRGGLTVLGVGECFFWLWRFHSPRTILHFHLFGVWDLE